MKIFCRNDGKRNAMEKNKTRNVSKKCRGGVSVLSRMVKEDLSGNVTVVQRPEGEEGVSHVNKWEKKLYQAESP